MEDRAHRGTNGLGIVEVCRTLCEGDPSSEGVGRADDGAYVPRVLNATQKDDAVPIKHKLFGGNVEEREHGNGSGWGGKRREPANSAGFGEEVHGRCGRFFYELLALGDEETLGFAVFLLFKLGEPFEHDGGNHTPEELSLRAAPGRRGHQKQPHPR